MGATCTICGASPAPFGLRVSGRWSELAPKWRAYLWTCGAEACQREAEARRAKVAGT